MFLRPNDIVQLLAEEDGTTSVEYAVLLALIIISMITALRYMSSATVGVWSRNTAELQAHGFMGP